MFCDIHPVEQTNMQYPKKNMKHHEEICEKKNSSPTAEI